MKKYFTYIKAGLTILLLVFIIVDLSGGSFSKADIETVAANTVKAAGMSDMTQAPGRMVKRFYGLNPKDYEGVVLYAPKDNMDAQELLIVKLKDISQQKSVEEAIQERLDTQLKSFEGYGAEQVALLNKHELALEGNYIFYMVGEKAQVARKALKKSM